MGGVYVAFYQNVTPGLADGVDQALDRGIPVVLASRRHAGAVSGVCGTAGGGKRLLERRVIPADDLPCQRARRKLVLALEAADSPGDIGECV